jgi:predicted DNA-binding transcriptional regulator AlpA
MPASDGARLLAGEGSALVKKPLEYRQLPELAVMLGVDRYTLKRLAATDPTFPPATPITKKTKLYSVAEMERWMERRRDATFVPPQSASVPPPQSAQGRGRAARR